jgi:hypothetical protein
MLGFGFNKPGEFVGFGRNFGEIKAVVSGLCAGERSA